MRISQFHDKQTNKTIFLNEPKNISGVPRSKLVGQSVTERTGSLAAGVIAEKITRNTFYKIGSSIPIIGSLNRMQRNAEYGGTKKVLNVLNFALQNYDRSIYQRNDAARYGQLSSMASGRTPWGGGTSVYHNAGTATMYQTMATQAWNSGAPTKAIADKYGHAGTRQTASGTADQIQRLKSTMLASAGVSTQAFQGQQVLTARQSMIAQLKGQGVNLGTGSRKDVDKEERRLQKAISGSVAGSKRQEAYQDQLTMLRSFRHDFGAGRYRDGRDVNPRHDKLREVVSNSFGFEGSYKLRSTFRLAQAIRKDAAGGMAGTFAAAKSVIAGSYTIDRSGSGRYHHGFVDAAYRAERLIAKIKKDAKAENEARKKAGRHRHKVENKARKKRDAENRKAAYKKAKAEAKENGTYKEFKAAEKAARKKKKEEKPAVERKRRRQLRRKQKKGSLSLKEAAELKALNAKVYLNGYISPVKTKFRRVFNPVTKRMQWVSGMWGKVSASRLGRGVAAVGKGVFGLGRGLLNFPLLALREIFNLIDLIKKKIVAFLAGAALVMVQVLLWMTCITVIITILVFFVSEIIDFAKEGVAKMDIRKQLDNLNYCQYIVDTTASKMGEQFLIVVEKEAETHFLTEPIEDIDGMTEFEERKVKGEGEDSEGDIGDYMTRGEGHEGHTGHYPWYYLINDGRIGKTISRETVAGDQDAIDGVNYNILPITSMMHYRFVDDLDFMHYPMALAYEIYMYTMSHDVKRRDNTQYWLYGEDWNTPIYDIKIADDCIQLYKGSDYGDIEDIRTGEEEFIKEGMTGGDPLDPVDPWYDRAKHIVKGREPGTTGLPDEECENLYVHTYKKSWGKKHMEDLGKKKGNVGERLEYALKSFLSRTWDGKLNEQMQKYAKYGGRGSGTTENQLRINGIMLDAANVMCFGELDDETEREGATPDDDAHTCKSYAEMAYSFIEDTEDGAVDEIEITSPKGKTTLIKVIPGIKFDPDNCCLTYPQTPKDDGYYDSAVNPEKKWDLSIGDTHSGPVPYYHVHTYRCYENNGDPGAGQAGPLICGLAERSPGDTSSGGRKIGGDPFKWLPSGGNKASVDSDYRTCFICLGHCGGHITPILDAVIDMSFENLERMDSFIVRHAMGKELPIAQTEVLDNAIVEKIKELTVYTDTAAWKSSWGEKAKRWFQPFPSNPSAFVELYAKNMAYNNLWAVGIAALDEWLNNTDSNSVFGNGEHGNKQRPGDNADTDGNKAGLFGVKDYFAFDGWIDPDKAGDDPLNIPKKAHKYTDDLESLYGKYEPGTNKSYAQGYELWPEFDVIFPGGINFEEELSKEECIDYFIKAFPSCSKGRALKIYTYNYPEDITCAEATVMEALKGVGQYYYVSDSGEAHLNAYMKRSGASDCSGFVSGVLYRAAHYGELPDGDSGNPPLMTADGYRGSPGDPQVGDIVFHEKTNANAWETGHVGIYIGNGKYVESTSGGDGKKGGSIISSANKFETHKAPSFSFVKPEKKQNP